VAIRTSSFYSTSAEPTTSASTLAIVRCVNLRKWFKPLDSAGDIKHTKKGVSLRLDEWSSLCNLVDVINKTFTSVDSALPCYYGVDHMNQLGWLNCIECHPFHVSLSQPAANSIAYTGISRHCFSIQSNY